MTIERAIQTDPIQTPIPVSDIVPVALTSTPIKEKPAPEINTEIISPIKPHREAVDPDYKTSNQSFIEAETEELEDAEKFEESLSSNSNDVVSER